jgi:hypothetical protein
MINIAAKPNHNFEWLMMKTNYGFTHPSNINHLAALLMLRLARV